MTDRSGPGHWSSDLHRVDPWRSGSIVVTPRPNGTGGYRTGAGRRKESAAWASDEARLLAARSPEAARFERTKRMLDVALCLVSLPFVLLALALAALAIKLDSSGPVLFIQERTGRGGRRFGMYKLRTMVQDAEERKAELADLNELSYPDFKITNDPRITRVGRFLRCTSLDELPQVFNVLRGDMSLVGPRPTSFPAGTYSLWHTERLEVKPGLTGLWQISGRHEIDFDERLRLDIAYVRNRTLRLDLLILLLTVGAVVSRRGAS